MRVFSVNNKLTFTLKSDFKFRFHKKLLTKFLILGYISTFVSVLPLGFIFDHYGTFVTRSICTLLMSLGLLMIMFIPEFNWLLFPGVLFLTAGSYSLLVTNNSLSSLFPKLTALILVLSEFTYALSSIGFRLWHILYGIGFSFKKIVLLNLSFTSIQWLRTFFLMPVGWTDSKIATFYLSPFYTKVWVWLFRFFLTSFLIWKKKLIFSYNL